MSLFKRIQQRLNEAKVTGDTENTVNKGRRKKFADGDDGKVNINQNKNSQNNSSQNTSKPKVTSSTVTTDSGRANRKSSQTPTQGIGNEFQDKRLENIKKQIDAENPTIKSADGKGNIPDTKANRIKVEKEKIKFKELQDKIKKETLKNQPLKTRISNKLKTYYKKINPSQISKLLKAARKNKYVKYGIAGAALLGATYNRFKPQSDSKTNKEIKDQTQTQTQTDLQNNNNNNKLTTTDNNNNNNKGIVTPPNKDKKIKLKPDTPIIYKFGLGVNDKKSK